MKNIKICWKTEENDKAKDDSCLEFLGKRKKNEVIEVKKKKKIKKTKRKKKNKSVPLLKRMARASRTEDMFKRGEKSIVD